MEETARGLRGLGNDGNSRAAGAASAAVTHEGRSSTLRRHAAASPPPPPSPRSTPPPPPPHPPPPTTLGGEPWRLFAASVGDVPVQLVLQDADRQGDRRRAQERRGTHRCRALTRAGAPPGWLPTARHRLTRHTPPAPPPPPHATPPPCRRCAGTLHSVDQYLNIKLTDVQVRLRDHAPRACRRRRRSPSMRPSATHDHFTHPRPAARLCAPRNPPLI